jgi:hypothetical protein
MKGAMNHEGLCSACLTKILHRQVMSQYLQDAEALFDR